MPKAAGLVHLCTILIFLKKVLHLERLGANVTAMFIQPHHSQEAVQTRRRRRAPAAGVREGLAPPMKEPAAGVREGLAPRMKVPEAGVAREWRQLTYETPLHMKGPLSRRRARVLGVDELPTDADFPGCRSERMTAQDLVLLDRHIEYWDARGGGVAWMCADYSKEHERPSHRLSVLLHYIAQARGAPIECYGTMTLLEMAPDGTRTRAMEADQTIYLDVERSNILYAPMMVRGEHSPPDLVVEVDNTTDVRRRKLALYEEWGFPEVWVEVPDTPAKGRPKSRSSGLTIHVLQRGSYVESAASLAFPGWSAEEIHVALNEGALSEHTYASLQRVGLALGRQEGKGPGNDPFMRRIIQEARAEGRDEGLEAGREEARSEGVVATVREVLVRRGIRLAPDSLLESALLTSRPLSEIMDCAFACTSAADFLQRLRARS